MCNGRWRVHVWTSTWIVNSDGSNVHYSSVNIGREMNGGEGETIGHHSNWHGLHLLMISVLVGRMADAAVRYVLEFRLKQMTKPSSHSQ